MAKEASAKKLDHHGERDVRREYYIVKASQLVADKKDNIRYDYGDIKGLAASLQAGKSDDGTKDIESPLVGQRIPGTNKYRVKDGFRRYYAMMYILETTGVDMECKMMPVAKTWSERETLLGMFTFNAGKALLPLEMAIGIKRLLALDMSQAQIARALAKTEAYISRLNKLNEAPEEAIALIKAGKVKAATIITEMNRKTLDTFLADVRAGKYDTTVGEPDEYAQPELFGDSPQGNLIDKAGLKALSPAMSAEGKPSVADKPAKSKKAGTISQRDIDKKREKEEPGLSSWKELKKVVSSGDLKVNSAKEGVYVFVLAVLNNEIDADKIKSFFNRKTWTL